MAFWRKNKTGKGLKYLFAAEFADGTILEQTSADVSKIDPIRSEFFDVLQFPHPLVKFALNGPETFASVDLRSGEFNVNGVRLFVDEGERAIEAKPLQVVFFRRHQEFVQVGKEGVEGQRSAPVRYFIGWQSTGKNPRQFTINFE